MERETFKVDSEYNKEKREKFNRKAKVASKIAVRSAKKQLLTSETYWVAGAIGLVHALMDRSPKSGAKAGLGAIIGVVGARVGKTLADKKDVIEKA